MVERSSSGKLREWLALAILAACWWLESRLPAVSAAAAVPAASSSPEVPYQYLESSTSS